MSKNKGSISIELCGTSTPEYESILQDALQVLQQQDISVSVDKKPEEEGRYIVIDVKDVGTIDREDMTEFLNALFTKSRSTKIYSIIKIFLNNQLPFVNFFIIVE